MEEQWALYLFPKHVWEHYQATFNYPTARERRHENNDVNVPFGCRARQGKEVVWWQNLEGLRTRSTARAVHAVHGYIQGWIDEYIKWWDEDDTLSERLQKMLLTPRELDEERCNICLADFDVDDEKPVLLPCGHVWGEECITPWLKSHGSCPLCRHDFQGELNKGRPDRVIARWRQNARIYSFLDAKLDVRSEEQLTVQYKLLLNMTKDEMLAEHDIANPYYRPCGSGARDAHWIWYQNPANFRETMIVRNAFESSFRQQRFNIGSYPPSKLALKLNGIALDAIRCHSSLNDGDALHLPPGWLS